jgi:RNA polymerase sigma-70 factor (ECF subfamily)
LAPERYLGCGWLCDLVGALDGGSLIGQDRCERAGELLPGEGHKLEGQQEGDLAECGEAVVARLKESPLPMAERDDDWLIERSLAGDQDAFEVLVRRHSPRVFSIIGSFFRRRDLVEDIAQEVFIKLYFSLGSYTLGRSFEAWVAKITVNACYDHLRAQRRQNEHFLQGASDAEREDEWLELQMLETALDRHASEERRREAADIAERLLAKLSPEDRLVLVLMDRDGFSVKEISEMLGWGQSKVKVRAFRARRALRAAMKRLIAAAERKQRSAKRWTARP